MVLMVFVATKEITLQNNFEKINDLPKKFG